MGDSLSRTPDMSLPLANTTRSVDIYKGITACFLVILQKSIFIVSDKLRSSLCPPHLVLTLICVEMSHFGCEIHVDNRDKYARPIWCAVSPSN